MIIDQPEKQDPVVDPAPQMADDLSYASEQDDEEEVPAYPYPQEDGDYAQENGDANPDQKPQPQPEPRVYVRPPPLPARTLRTPLSTVSSDDAYTRDPHKLVAYLIPFPKPRLHPTHAHTHAHAHAHAQPHSASEVPDRFLVYTPPPPPLTKPASGEKEAKGHLVRRKWQAEVREAKTSTAKGAGWKGVKSKATRGIDWAIGRTTSSGLDFLNRVGGDDKVLKDEKKKDKDKERNEEKHAKEEEAARARAQGEEVQLGPDGLADGDARPREEVGLTELVLVYPSTFRDSPEGMRKEFVESMMRTKSKAERDTILATGLLPVAFAIDILAMVIWPFGGLAEIDSVWAYASFRGAKVARSTTKRLEASEGAEEPADEGASQTASDGAGTGGKSKKSKKE